eukprot:Rhum_TRINITY_DN14824_c2_g1::Rhum_TRINITY_DN14824_c2_g1_i1::g.119329::m.119329
MQSFLSYVDPTKPLKWMLGKEGAKDAGAGGGSSSRHAAGGLSAHSSGRAAAAAAAGCGGGGEAWRSKRIAVLFCGAVTTPASPASPCSFRRRDDCPVSWAEEAGYAVLDWRGEDVVRTPRALEEVGGVDADACVVATSDPDLPRRLRKRGLRVEALLLPGGPHTPQDTPLPASIRAKEAAAGGGGGGSMRTLQYRKTRGSLRGCLVQSLGEGAAAALELSVDVLSDEGEALGEAQEMEDVNPFTELGAELARGGAAGAETIECLLAVAENLLYRGLENKYRAVRAGTQRFEQVFGRVPAATALLGELGFELVGDWGGVGPCYVIPEEAPLDHEKIQHAVTMLGSLTLSSPVACRGRLCSP